MTTKKLTQSEIKAAQKNQRDLYQLLSTRVGNAVTWDVEMTIWHHCHGNDYEEEINHTVSVFSNDGTLDGDGSFRAGFITPERYADMVARLEAFLDKYYPKK